MLNLAKHIDFYTDISNAADFNACCELIYSEFEKHEVSSIYFGCMGDLNALAEVTNTEAIHGFSNHPQAWFDEFGIDKCLDNDSTIDLCLAAKDIIFWHDEEQWTDASSEQKEQAAFENEIGMKTGATIPLHTMGQNNTAMIGVTTSGVNERQFDLFWKENGRTICEISEIANMVIQNQHMTDLCHRVNLTDRCQEFLTLCALGNSYKQIAIKMCLSLPTIHQIAKQCVTQLHARNVVNAVFKAANLNLLKL